MTTAAGRRLTLSHRRGQLRIAANTIATLRAAWTILDPENLDGTFDRWAAVSLPVIAAQRTASSQLAAAYLTAFRRAEIGEPGTPVLAGPVDAAAVTTSLMVTGPVSVKNNTRRGVPLVRAMSVAEAASSAAAMRHVLDGGRETIEATTRTDPRRTGWERVLSGDACNYCQGLAAEAATDPRAAFVSHDGCGCTPAPVYS